MYLYVEGVQFASLNDFSIGFWIRSDTVVFLVLCFGSVQTVWYFQHCVLDPFRQCGIFSIVFWIRSGSMVFLILCFGSVQTVWYFQHCVLDSFRQCGIFSISFYFVILHIFKDTTAKHVSGSLELLYIKHQIR